MNVAVAVDVAVDVVVDVVVVGGLSPLAC